jgi:hypothetical protein
MCSRNADHLARFPLYDKMERTLYPRVLLHQRGLTVIYLRLMKAQRVNVGTAVFLPPTPVAADLASGERPQQGRGSVVVAEVTLGLGDGSTAHRAKGASSTATLKE